MYYKIFFTFRGVIINKNSIIGPYARLRPGTVLKENTKVGNFVEVKKIQFLDQIQKQVTYHTLVMHK